MSSRDGHAGIANTINKSDMNLSTHNGRADLMEVTVEHSGVEAIEEKKGTRVSIGGSYEEKDAVKVYIANESTVRDLDGSAKVEEILTPIQPTQDRDGGQISLGCRVLADGK
ncbi:hypothetical protein LTR56_023705 [Elasticomyces elasticus]|nr:hypothetical protein LTR22_025843 [Elasticomyces elasticus]KAK3619954.1 hypothetical protein LTR56_023705 [Elasticomyces elasticus]KAK5740199.1 hypothetical protein LTS12_025012 [Elasticomyces elasticus]